MATIRSTLFDLSPYAEGVHEHIVEVSNNLQNVQIDTGGVFRFANLVQQSVQYIFVIAQVIASNVSEIVAQHQGNFSKELIEALQALSEARQADRDAQSAYGLIQIQHGQSQNLSSNYQYLNDSLESLLLVTTNLIDRGNDLRRSLSDINVTTELLKSNIPTIEYTITFSSAALDCAEADLRRAEYALIMVMDDIQTLAALTDNSDMSRITSGYGSTWFSGSGMPDIKPTLPAAEPEVDTFVGAVEVLRRTVAELEQMLVECAGVIQQAMDFFINVSTLADQINRYM